MNGYIRSCIKCGKRDDVDNLHRIHLNNIPKCVCHKARNMALLCSRCRNKWIRIYKKWHEKKDYDFWAKGWNEFLHVDRPYNPSRRTSR